MERMRVAALICMSLFLTQAPVPAQEEGGGEAAPAPEAKPQLPAAQRLERALAALQERENVLASLEVKQVPPERGMGMMGGGAQVQVMVGGATPSRPFEGEAEVWLRPNAGNLVVVSRKKVPGFGVYHTPDRTLTELLYEDEAPSLKGLNDELRPLFELNRLLRWAKRDGAGYKVSEDAGQGTTTLKGRAPRKAVRQPDGAGGPMDMIAGRPKVLRIDMLFELDQAGELSELTFTVVRNDPAAKLIEEHLVKQGLPVPPKNEDGETEGVSSVYRLKFDRKRPSPRAKEFRKQIEAYLTSEK